MSHGDIYNTKLEELRKLHPNWDGYDGMPPSEAALGAAKRFMDSLFIVPAPDGSVQLEWHSNDLDLEIAFKSDGMLEDFSFDYKCHYNDEFESIKVAEYKNADVIINERPVEDHKYGIFGGVEVYIEDLED